MPDLSSNQALQRLRDGNARFVAGDRDRALGDLAARRGELTEGQDPFAIVLGCSDSRVPAEIVFDQGLGDLFVIRVAGNIVAPSQIGSIEFAAEQFGVPLVVVLGHSECGAVRATLDAGAEDASPNLRSIVDRIRPALAELDAAAPDAFTRAVRANVRMSVAQLRAGSPILEGLLRKGALSIVGAEYSLETGVVDFFEGV
jgi:carbonic anhydrase